MAITIISDPGESVGYPYTGTKPLPIPVSDCLEWCLQPDSADVITGAGSKAKVVFTIPATPTIPANGTVLKVWGYTFTVQSGSNYTSNSFKVTTNGIETAANLRNMLNSNIKFAQAGSAVLALGAAITVTFSWNDCREQPNFTGANMVFTAMTSMGGTGGAVATNGATPTYSNGYQLVVRLMKWDSATSAHIPVTEFEAINVKRGCASVESECVDYMAAAKKVIYTPMPDLSDSSEIASTLDTVTGRFALQYGWTYRDESCQVLYGTTLQSEDYLVMNAVFPIQETYKTRRFFDGNLPTFIDLPQFMTNQPAITRLTETSFAWLWMYNGWVNTLPTATSYRLRIRIFKVGTASLYDTVLVTYSLADWWQCLCANVSVSRVVNLSSLITSASEIDYYTCRIEVMQSTTVLGQTNDVRYSVDHSCANNDNVTDLYFVSPYGGICTIICDIDEKTITSEFTEIALDVPCTTATNENAKYKGLSTQGLSAYESYTLTVVDDYTLEQVEFFKSVKSAPEHWIKVQDIRPELSDIGYTAIRFLPDADGIQIFQRGETIALKLTGRIARDLPTQLPK